MNYYSKDLQKDLIIFDPALLQTQLDTLEEPDVNGSNCYRYCSHTRTDH